MKRFQYAILSILAAFLFYRGVLPAMEGVATDFPNYYTSARLLVERDDLSRLYNDAWFQNQIYRYGMQQLGKFSPYPPVTVFVMTPLTIFSPVNALRVWTMINLLLLALVIFLLSRIADRTWMWSALLVLMSGHALANNFRFGQFYLVLTALVTAGYLYWNRGGHVQSGVLLGIGAAVKYFPLLFFLEFLFRKEWKILLSGFLTIGAIAGVSIAILGPAIHEQFLFHILGRHLEGNIQNPFSPTFQSWNSLFRRFFILDPIRNPKPPFDSSSAFVFSLCFVYILVTGLMAIALRQAAKQYGDFGKDLQFAMLGIGGLLLLPASATYHFLLLTPSAAILLKRTPWTNGQKAFGIFYGAMGFIPYRLFEQFASSGILTCLAYPRLILMSCLFGAAIHMVWRGPSDSQTQADKTGRVQYAYSS